MTFIGHLFKNKFNKFVLMWFLAMTLCWVILWFSFYGEKNSNYLLLGAVYGTVLTFCAGVAGLVAAHYWGGTKSVMGRAIMFLSLGVFAQFFGQAVFSFYNIVLDVEVPYPSIADIGYFGVIPLYIAGILSLAKASGIAVRLKAIRSQIQTAVIPLVMILISYVMFLRGYSFADMDALTVFLDFGYPVGQGIFVALAILTYSLSRDVLGGLMRNRILIILVAFFLQYLADFNFLYQNISETWRNGGYGDYLYLLAYVVMALGIGQLYVTGRELKGNKVTTKE